MKKNITSKPIQYDKVWQTIILDTNGQSFKDRTCQNKYIFTKSKKKKDSVASINWIKQVKYIMVKVNKGNNKITELRATLQRESQNS